MSTPGNIYYKPQFDAQDAYNFSPPEQTTLGQGFLQSVSESMMTNPISNLGYDIAYGYDKYIANSPFLTPSQLKEKGLVRPGVSFPDGTKENVAQLVIDRHDADQQRQTLINNMNPGFISETAKVAGNIIGFSLDPVNAAASVLAPELIGAKVAISLGKGAKMIGLGAKSTRLATGALEGSAAVLPQEIFNIPSSRLRQENESIAQGFLNIGLGAGLGGLLHLGFGKSAPIFDSDINKTAHETAIGQIVEGKQTHVEPLIKQGAYESAKGMDEAEAKGLAPSRDDMASDLSDAKTQLQDELDTITNKMNQTMISPEQTAEMTNHLSGIKTVLSDSKIALQKQFIQTMKGIGDQSIDFTDVSPDQINQQFNRLSKKTVDLSTENADLVKQVKQLTRHQANTDDLLKSSTIDINNSALDDAEKVKIATKLANKYEKFESDLKKVGIDVTKAPEFTKMRNALSEIKDKQIILSNHIQDHETAIQLLTQPHNPLTQQELKAASDYQASYRAASGYNEVETQAYKNFINSLPDEQDFNIESMQAEIEEMHENGELTDNDLDELDQVNNDLDDIHNARMKGIDMAAECLGNPNG